MHRDAQRGRFCGKYCANLIRGESKPSPPSLPLEMQLLMLQLFLYFLALLEKFYDPEAEKKNKIDQKKKRLEELYSDGNWEAFILMNLW